MTASGSYVRGCQRNRFCGSKVSCKDSCSSSGAIAKIPNLREALDARCEAIDGAKRQNMADVKMKDGTTYVGT